MRAASPSGFSFSRSFFKSCPILSQFFCEAYGRVGFGSALVATGTGLAAITPEPFFGSKVSQLKLSWFFLSLISNFYEKGYTSESSGLISCERSIDIFMSSV